MTCIATEEHHMSLPGAYCHDNTTNNITSTFDTYSQQEDNNNNTSKDTGTLAIISPIFFSPSLSPTSLRTSLPGAWVDTSPYQEEKEINNENPSLPYQQTTTTTTREHVDMTHLRQTIATLREQAKQLEETDLVVKKSIQVVAKKRLLAHHQRRLHSQWDWCDEPNDTNNNKNSVPFLDDMDDGTETDQSDQNDDHERRDDCGSDWEWID
ncbi:uncharacterized protein BX664DRAFT_89399 [Halteromyces radiatus]|uniref:uncharacterized protein n=1 Tax=Halteromyces radiatus TaxID=101107 RepID=UPI00221F2192|nr:uncharacterized protein BX664DRAFT_89399 [Halteromyces radiatus]KAI8092532.1 hypothetical protein BX664DRAFT_89399 [Halteromyces radiatus]